MLIEHAGGRYHVAVDQWALLYFFLKHLALFGSCRLMRSRAASLRCWICGLVCIFCGLPGAAQERPTDNADERRPLLLGQWLATAEVAEVVIAPMFSASLNRCAAA